MENFFISRCDVTHPFVIRETYRSTDASRSFPTRYLTKACAPSGEVLVKVFEGEFGKRVHLSSAVECMNPPNWGIIKYVLVMKEGLLFWTKYGTLKTRKCRFLWCPF